MPLALTIHVKAPTGAAAVQEGPWDVVLLPDHCLSHVIHGRHHLTWEFVAGKLTIFHGFD